MSETDETQAKTEGGIDADARYALYRQAAARCAHCGVKIVWEAFEVKGLQGGWLLERSSPDADDAAPVCFRCHADPPKLKRRFFKQQTQPLKK